MTERKRPVNLTMSDRTRTRIEGLKGKLDSDSLSEVIRRSIELMDVLTERRLKGDAIILRSPDGSEMEVILST